MQNQNKPLLFQINDTLKFLTGLFGREVTLEELIEFGQGKPSYRNTNAVREVELAKAAVKRATRKAPKAKPKPLTTPGGVFSKNLKKEIGRAHV